MSGLRRVRGTADLLAEAFRAHEHIYSVGKRIASRYGYEEVQTPCLEHKETFVRTLGTTSDVVSKEMFEMSNSRVEQSSRNEKVVCLRPENTAGVMRAVLENGLFQKLPKRYFYSGPMFRYERPQRGRLRQFHQLGIESLGTFGVSSDADAILLAADFLENLGFSLKSDIQCLKSHAGPVVELRLNTLGGAECREKYSETLSVYLKDWILENPDKKLSSESLERLRDGRVMRILDSKSEQDRECIAGAPLLRESLSLESQSRFSSLCSLLDGMGVNYIIDDHLVRGLDYYCHTAFEFTTVGDSNSNASRPVAVLAGGRYDMLATLMNSKRPVPAIGWAAGVERLALELERCGKGAFKEEFPGVYLVPLLSHTTTDDLIKLRSLQCASLLRKHGIPVVVSYNQADADELELTSPKKRQNIIKKGIKEADKAGARFACFIGEEESLQGECVASLKDLETGELFTSLREEELKARLSPIIMES